MARLETGTVRCDGDWTGVFIRGDNAMMAFAPALRALIEGQANPIHKARCRLLLGLLISVADDAGNKPQLVCVRDDQ